MSELYRIALVVLLLLFVGLLSVGFIDSVDRENLQNDTIETETEISSISEFQYTENDTEQFIETQDGLYEISIQATEYDAETSRLTLSITLLDSEGLVVDANEREISNTEAINETTLSTGDNTFKISINAWEIIDESNYTLETSTESTQTQTQVENQHSEWAIDIYSSLPILMFGVFTLIFIRLAF